MCTSINWSIVCDATAMEATSTVSCPLCRVTTPNKLSPLMSVDASAPDAARVPTYGTTTATTTVWGRPALSEVRHHDMRAVCRELQGAEGFELQRVSSCRELQGAEDFQPQRI